MDEEGLEVRLLRQIGEVKTGLRKSNWRRYVMVTRCFDCKISTMRNISASFYRVPYSGHVVCVCLCVHCVGLRTTVKSPVHMFSVQVTSQQDRQPTTETGGQVRYDQWAGRRKLTARIFSGLPANMT